MEELFAKYNINIPRVKGGQYCDMVSTLVKKFDLLGIVDDKRMKKICKDLGFVNKSLNKAYQIIFKKGYGPHKVIEKLTQLRDPYDKHFINRGDAKDLVSKFQTLSQKLTGGADADLANALDNVDDDDDNNQRTKSQPKRVKKISEADSQSADMGHQLNNMKRVKAPPVMNMLTPPQKKVIGDTFDMMEVLLVCLSLLPIAGWTFDFPLVIYSLANKKYTLVMITVLNWYIWAFCLIFGMNINLGPTMKATYLGNHENVVKKALLYPEKEPTKVMEPFTQAQVQRLSDGKNYLVDKNGNVYSAQVTSPKTVGVLTIDNRFVKRNDPEYEQALLNHKKALKKQKVGPTNLV